MNCLTREVLKNRVPILGSLSNDPSGDQTHKLPIWRQTLYQMCPLEWCPMRKNTFREKVLMVNILKFQTLYSLPFFLLHFAFCYMYILLLMQPFLKILSGTANSVDPDQTAPEEAVWSRSALFTYSIFLATLVYEIWGHLPHLGVAPAKMLFLFSFNNIHVCCGYSLESPQQDDSIEHLQPCNCGKYKNIYLATLLVLIYITIFTLSIEIPYHTSLKIWTSPLCYLFMCLKQSVLDESAASDQGLHCLLRVVCPNI